MNSKKKGNRVELEFAKILSNRFNDTFRRVPASGAHGTNLANTNLRQDAKEILTGDIICPQWFEFTVEIKSRIDFNFWDLLNRDTENEIDQWIEQAKREAIVANKEWFIIVKINNKKPFIILNNNHLIDYDLTYKKNYGIIRFDYFLKLSDIFFGKDNTNGITEQNKT